MDVQTVTAVDEIFSPLGTRHVLLDLFSLQFHHRRFISTAEGFSIDFSLGSGLVWSGLVKMNVWKLAYQDRAWEGNVNGLGMAWVGIEDNRHHSNNVS